MQPARRPAALALLALAALAAGAAPSLAAPPPDAFCVVLIEGLDGLRAVRVTVDQETGMPEREALFGALDRDGDGQVTREENARWVREGLDVRAGPFANASHRMDAWADGAGGPRLGEPLHTALWRQVGHTFHKQDHVQPWPVREAADLETQEVREARFDHVQDNTSFVRLEMGVRPAPTSSTSDSRSSTSQTVIEYVVVRAPPGWVVARVEGTGYGGWFEATPNAAEADLPGLDTKGYHVVSFARLPADPDEGANATQTRSPAETVTVTVPAEPGPRGAPGAAFVPAVLALAAVAAAVRQRL